MTRILLFLLKCVVGVFATIGFLLIAAFVVAAIVIPRFNSGAVSRATMPDATVLVLDLADGLVESRPTNPLARASLGGALVMHETVAALEAASRDDRVKGLVVRAGWGSPGLAQVQELRDALTAFRDQGKPVIAFAETFGEAGDGTLHYYLASAAGEVWMQPSGDLGITGFALEQPFLKELLDEYGVRSQIAQREEYKGAMSFLSEEHLPEPQRQNLQRYLDSALSQIATAVAASRNLEAGAVRDLIDRAPYHGEEAQSLGLVDQLGYWHEVETAVEESLGDDAEWLSLSDYGRSLQAPAPDSPVIALIRGEGPIVLDSGENDPVFGRVTFGALDIADALASAIDDPKVEAIVFRVESPGGSYVASDTIWREVQRAREVGKPLVVSMGNVAASGGYFVSAAAARIVAQPGTITGSIGVVSGKISLTEFWASLGVSWDGVQAGNRANMWSSTQPFSRDQWEWLQQTMDTTYADFTGKVAAGRDMTQDEVLASAKGQIWSGADALEAGLVDELGGYRRAIDIAKEIADIAPETEVQLRAFPAPRDPFSALAEYALGREIESPATQSMVNSFARLTQALAPLVETVDFLGRDPRSRSLQLAPLTPVN